MPDASETGSERDDLEAAVGEYGDLVTTMPRMFCEDCERFIYATWGTNYRETAYHLECECKSIRPDLERPDSWHSVKDLVDDGPRADGGESNRSVDTEKDRQ